MIRITTAFLLILISVSISTSCRNTIRRIVMSGNTDSLDGIKVRITNQDFSRVYDSTVVKNNTFQFSISLPKEGFYLISFKQRSPDNSRDLILGEPRLIYLEEDAKYRIDVNGRNQLSENNYRITSNSLPQQKLDKYQSNVSLERKRLKILKNDYSSRVDIYLEQGNDRKYKQHIDSVIFIERKQDLLSENSMREFIKVNSSTLLTPYFITQMSDFFENYELYKKALDGLDADIKKTDYAKKANTLLKASENLRIGGIVPPIYGNDVYGKPLTYDYAGKRYTLINIWASWCVDCRYQTPELKKLYQQYKKAGFNIIAVSVDKDKEWWLRISKYDSIPWHNVGETVKLSYSKNIKNFEAKRLPLNYLINSQKKIIARNLDMSELSKFLKDSLKENAKTTEVF